MTKEETAQTTGVITLLHLEVDKRAQSEVENIYHELTPHLLAGADEFQLSLLAENNDQQSTESRIIVSYWQSLQAYQEWERGEHRRELRPLVRLVKGLRPETFVCVG
jgi:heme-degrading monooxygenase HmoA